MSAVDATLPLPSGTTTADNTRSPWVIGPWIDLLFVCGGGVWIFALLDRLAHRSQTEDLVATLALVATVLGHATADAHTASTLVRVYGDPVERSRFSLYTGWLLLPVLAVTAVGFSVDGAAPALLKIYLLWVLQHYAGQTAGFALIYLFKRSYPMDAPFRSAFGWMFTATWVWAVTRHFVWREWGAATFLGVQVPFWGPLPKWVGWLTLAWALTMIAVVVFHAVRTWSRTGRVLPLPVVVLMLTYFGFTFASGPLSSLLWVWVPVLFHGSQYVLLSASYQLKTHDRWSRKLLQPYAVGYFLLVAAGGAAIYLFAPWLAWQAGAKWKVGVATLFSVVNFHHFLTDRAIWRLRDPEVRERLLA